MRDAHDSGSVPGCTGLAELPDEELLARCHDLPWASAERAAACEVLVRRYESLVRACVWQYRGSPEPVEDLIQVGYIGLLKAINNYDPAFGNGLRAYAAPCIGGEIKRHFRDKRWQIHVSRSVQELLLAMRDAVEDLTHELGRQPADGELAARLGVAVGDLREARQAEQAFSAHSLDAPLLAWDVSAELGDVLGEEDAGLERAIDMESVSKHWDELPRKEQRVLVLRFYGNLSQEQIAGRLGVSQMQVSRLLVRALAHLRKRLLGDPARSRRELA